MRIKVCEHKLSTREDQLEALLQACELPHLEYKTSKTCHLIGQKLEEPGLPLIEQSGSSWHLGGRPLAISSQSHPPLHPI